MLMKILAIMISFILIIMSSCGRTPVNAVNVESASVGAVHEVTPYKTLRGGSIQEIRIDGCEYLVGNMYQNAMVIIHKANCDNHTIN
jgi:hypothetical protein